jgi:hypothetical protein
MAVNQDRVGKCRMIDALIDAEGYSTGTAPTVTGSAREIPSNVVKRTMTRRVTYQRN